jgi:hypothetical protein
MVRLFKTSASKAAGVRTLVGRRVVMLHQFIKK